MTGYVSVSAGKKYSVVKTTDGGLTWQEMFVAPYPDNVEATGIGFVNDTVGWLGGHSLPMDFMTTDGGNTWTSVNLDPFFNRFRKINDTTAYICGKRVWKDTKQSVGLTEVNYDKPGYVLNQNTPNPFSSRTTISYTIPEKGFVTLRVFDNAGRQVRTLVESRQGKGAYSYDLELPNIADGQFYCKLSANGVEKVMRMVMVKE